MNDTKNGPKTTEKESTPDNALRVEFPGDLRDWFAGMALSGIHASYTNGFPDPELAATQAYQHADAMLDARTEGGEK